MQASEQVKQTTIREIETPLAQVTAGVGEVHRLLVGIWKRSFRDFNTVMASDDSDHETISAVIILCREPNALGSAGPSFKVLMCEDDTSVEESKTKQRHDVTTLCAQCVCSFTSWTT